jgi:hypothetical protein
VAPEVAGGTGERGKRPVFHLTANPAGMLGLSCFYEMKISAGSLNRALRF